MGIGILSMMIAHPGFHVVVAERDGVVRRLQRASTSAPRSPASARSPSIPAAQNAGVGRLLMHHVIERAKRFAGVRLVQAAFHNRSLSLYTKLGFDPREPLSCVTGNAARAADSRLPRCAPRPQTDLAACDAVCRRVHGHTRSGEVADAIRERQRAASCCATVASPATRRASRSSATPSARRNEDVQALIAAAPAFHGPGFLVPTRNAALLRWCLEQGLRIVQPLTLMSMGRYDEPRGAWLASISY